MGLTVWSVVIAVLEICTVWIQANVQGKEVTNVQGKEVTNVNARFLVTVGEPWNQCNATAATPYVKAGANYSVSPKVQVGNCDHGPIQFKVLEITEKAEFVVAVTFWTSVIAAMPPTCSFKWDGGYQNPTPKSPDLSPLPGCYTSDSQEGYHATDYMFHLLMWDWY